MSYAIVPEPGGEYGPCLDDDCAHIDCAALRRQLVNVACSICGEPMRPGQKWTGDRLTDPNRALNAHYVCVME